MLARRVLPSGRLGASVRRRDFLTDCQATGCLLALAGLIVGLAASFGLTRRVASFPFGVGAWPRSSL